MVCCEDWKHTVWSSQNSYRTAKQTAILASECYLKKRDGNHCQNVGKIIIIPNSQGHSFFPVTIRRWNALPQNMQLNPSLYCFKTYLHTRNIKIKSSHFKSHVRLEYSFLFQRKLNNSPLCIFGEVESTDNFLLHFNISLILNNCSMVMVDYLKMKTTIFFTLSKNCLSKLTGS